MPLATPKLDDRHFQDIVDEAKKRIPYYIEEWTDHNVSDPGVTMIELFAWMTDTILYRLNQVPDLHYVKYMELLGMHLKEPVPAKAMVTFWLSAPQETPALIPAGTEVASTQTETQPSIIFTTNDDFIIKPPRLKSVLSYRVNEDNEREYRPYDTKRLIKGLENIETFSTVPREGDALYFGFENNLSHHIVSLNVDCDPTGGAGIDPTQPPYVWEVSTGSQETPWASCVVDTGEDSTKGMNVAGRIRMHLPQMGQFGVNKQNLYWLRARLLHQDEYAKRMRPYRTTPRLRQVAVGAWGGATAVTHSQRIKKEFLGQSDGAPGQEFQLQVTPILKRRPGEILIIQDGDDLQQWQEVPDFSRSTGNDRHFTLDSVTGEVRLGPSIRQPDGTMKRYGAIPPRGAQVVFQCYRYGGGLDGNVQAGIINTLKTAIPYIDHVTNREAAAGGLDAESMEAAKMRAPALLRSRDRAVTEDDFVFLAREALRDTGWDNYRVHCLQPVPSRESRIIPGQVYLLIVPHIQAPEERLRPSSAQLELQQDDIYQRLVSYLNKRRLLTVRLDIRAPVYYWVAARVTARALPGVNHAQVEEELLNRLYRFLNPLIGGQDGKGWPFGRDLVISDLHQCLQGVPGVQFIRNAQLFVTATGEGPRGDPVEAVDVVGHGVIASGIHEVIFD
ncbi:MAG: putative baseplate assembly protein [Anaerolineae bacterium]